MKKFPQNWYRDLWLFLITFVLLLVVKTVVVNVQEIKEGRRIGTTITCVITSSILQGSHTFIVASSSQALPGKIEGRLVREGYPRKEERKKIGEQQADAYTRAIADAVVAAAGPQARGLIVETGPAKGKRGPSAGTLNCARLKTITHVG